MYFYTGKRENTSDEKLTISSQSNSAINKYTTARSDRVPWKAFDGRIDGGAGQKPDPHTKTAILYRVPDYSGILADNTQ
jgi:hypothetical protein